MSLRIRRIGLNNFRKFREPLTIEGLTDGLNIVIEPNEAGKSTLLEALRGAFFVRHSTKNQLAQSFAPHGEAVAPEVNVSFEVDGDDWTVRKRFLKNPIIEVAGPNGRAQGDEAESRLQDLLGFVRDTSQRGDPNAYGALGLLWVAQTDALKVTAPSNMVRETVRSTLEAEVGTILGGAAYERVRARIDEQYKAYWTPTGKPAGKLVEAREYEGRAKEAATEATARLDALEKTFTELDASRARLKVIERDLADDTETRERVDLLAALETARAAMQILATRQAETEAARSRLRSLEDLETRFSAASAAAETARLALSNARNNRATLADELTTAKATLDDAGGALRAAREMRKQTRETLAKGEAQAIKKRRQSAIAAARQRHEELLIIEDEIAAAKMLSASLIPAETIQALEDDDRAIAQARAAVNAGATVIELVGKAPGLTIDSEPMLPGARTITRETRIGLRQGAELVVRPPPTATSAEARLAEAVEKHRLALTELGLDDLAGARARNDAAREAAANVRALEARINAATRADEMLALPAGADALKLFIAGLDEDETTEEETEPSLETLRSAVEEAEVAVAQAEVLHESAINGLRDVEERDSPLAATEAGAVRDLANAEAQLTEIEAHSDFAGLEVALAKAREEAAGASVKLAAAERDAAVYSVQTIAKKIETIDARARVAGERRTQLLQDIARLETTVETEGGKGLSDRAAAAWEEAEAAVATVTRITEEAETIKLLRTTLDEARAETSRTFVGPVAKRAMRHIERLLPGCNLTFTEDLELGSVIRAGVSEGCGDLSRGTQEQLAVLTRLAFADMLLEQGAPVSLILDDPLVYSDDARLDLMIEILMEAAGRMQVILLTCRDRAFRHLDGNRVVLESVA